MGHSLPVMSTANIKITVRMSKHLTHQDGHINLAQLGIQVSLFTTIFSQCEEDKPNLH